MKNEGVGFADGMKKTEVQQAPRFFMEEIGTPRFFDITETGDRPLRSWNRARRPVG